MNPKIDKLAKDIEKAQSRVGDLQARLREMEQQKAELEETEVVALFRALEVPPDRFPAFLDAMKNAVLPAADSAPPVAAVIPHPYTHTPDNEEVEDED